jgi:hypothetical protein
MPTPEGYGVTPTGFLAPNVDEANELFISDLQGIFGAGIDTGPKSNFGQLAGVMGERYADCFAMGQDTYNAGTPDGAAGAALDFVNGIRGVTRLAAESSTVQETLTGTPSAGPIPQGSIVASAIGTQFETTVPVTFPLAAGGPPAGWVALTPYAQGAVVLVGSSLYLCTTAGTSGANGPSGYEATIPDGTVVWAYAGEAVSPWTSGTSYLSALKTTRVASGQAADRVTYGGFTYACVGYPGTPGAASTGSTAPPGVAQWVSGTVYASGAYVFSSGHFWHCTTSGSPSASVDAPNGSLTVDGYQWANVTDGYSWVELGAGSVAVDVPCQSVLTGPQPGGPGSLTAIMTPVSGWLGAYNVLTVTLGQNLEQDDGGVPGPGYRIRGEQEIRAGGGDYVDEIRLAVLNALIAINEDNAASTVTVIENATSFVDGSGRPPNSFEVIVSAISDPGGDPATNLAIATAIFQNKPAGIATCSEGGTTPDAPYGVPVLDSEGNNHFILFSIPASQACYAALTIHIDQTVLTSDENAAAQVAALMSSFAAGLGAGRNLPAGILGAQAFGINVVGAKPGVLDVTGSVVGTTSTPASAYVAISNYQFAYLPSGVPTFTSGAWVCGNIAVTVVHDDD